MTVRFRTFRKHRGPCGQPAVLGETMRFRPVPPQTGHFERINATPSDLPFMSTGFATYPLPPQFGQSSGATPSPPQVENILYDISSKISADFISLRITNKPCQQGQRSRWIMESPRSDDKTKLTIIAFDVGVLLPSATLSMGTRTFVSGKYVATQRRGIS